MFGFPPVSPSKIIGFVVTSNISSIDFILDEMSAASISGLPFEVESVNELDQNPSNQFLNCLLFQLPFQQSMLTRDYELLKFE